jgi:hypothetical protein
MKFKQLVLETLNNNLHVEVVSINDKRDRFGYIQYKCKITGTFKGIDFDNPNTYFASYKNMFNVEHHPRVKNESNGYRIPGLEQIGPEIPYPEPYWSLCREVGTQIHNQESIKQIKSNLKSHGIEDNEQATNIATAIHKI